LSKPDREYDPAILESELKGKTLLVYWYLIQQSSHAAGAREVQRALRFSSPSIAVHHLEKLQDLGLVDKRGTGDYVLMEEVKVGILRFFMRMGRFVVPRYLFYSVLLSTMLATYVVLCVVSQVYPSFYAIVFGAVGSFLFWFETIRLWRAKPI
jgi:DNA-binding transcriptional ArsR family regulator